MADCRGEELARSIEEVADGLAMKLDHWEYVSGILRTYARRIREHQDPDSVGERDFYKAVDVLRLELAVVKAYVEAGCAPRGPRGRP